MLNTIDNQSNFKIELESQKKGYKRYLSKQLEAKDFSERKSTMSMIEQSITSVSEELKKAIDAERSKTKEGSKGGRLPTWFADIEPIPIETLAYLGLHHCFNCAVKEMTVTQVTNKIGSGVELEHWSKAFSHYENESNTKGALAKRVDAQVSKRHSSRDYRVKSARNIAAKEGFIQEPWSDERKTKVAAVILSSILEATNLFEIIMTAFKGKRKSTLMITKAAHAAILLSEQRAAWMEPVYPPMTVAPKPWTDVTSGCYHDPRLAQTVDIVRFGSRDQINAVQHLMSSSETPPAFIRALNAIQATPLKVNTEVLRAVEWAWEEGLRFGKFPIGQPPEFPTLPENWREMPEAKVTRIKKDQAKWFKLETMCLGAAQNMRNDLETANKMDQFDQFYLPWSLDFRGRMYPIPSYNFHRDDHIKSQFLLSRGKRLLPEDHLLFRVHLANCGDFDKISKKPLADREQWVLDNHDQILAVAVDYQSTFDHWSKADKPFQYLAACLEYARWVDEGDDFVSYIPVSLDGTNSGIQHYSMATRSSEDGFKVNLVPNQDCQDLYGIVADKVTTVLKSHEDTAAAKQWLDYGITRSVCKRNCMTWAYNSNAIGMSAQLREDLMDPVQRKVDYGDIPEHPFGDGKGQWDAASFLGRINYTTISQTLQSVAGAMDYLKGSVAALCAENKGCRWVSPSGFPVIQHYKMSRSKEIKIYLYDRTAKQRKRSKVSLSKTDGRVYTRKCLNAVAANFVHSLDSAHMCLSINQALDLGVEDFFMIHDSFGTTAGDARYMYYAVRKSLVTMYEENDVLAQFDASVRQQLTDPETQLPPLPSRGDLDITQIPDSEFCFS